MNKPWTRPLVREAIVLWLRLLRAAEEIKRLNVKIKHLDHHIAYMVAHIDSTATKLRETNPLLAEAVLDSYSICRLDNEFILWDLTSTQHLAGYNGPKELKACKVISTRSGKDTQTDEDEWLDVACEEEVPEDTRTRLERTEMVLTTWPAE